MSLPEQPYLALTAAAATADSNTHIGIPAGIVIGLLASFVQSLGLTIQRKSHVLNQQLPQERQRVEHRRPLWLLGFAIFISSNILGSLVQIASLPVVILAPLGAVSLLWNAFFARFLLGDVFSPWMILGTLLIAGGAVLIAVFGIVPEPTRSLEDLLELFRRPTFVVYFSLLGGVVVVCLAITHIVEYSFTRKLVEATDPSPPMSPLASPIAPTANPSALSTGVTETLTTERTPLLDRKATTDSAPHSPVRLMAPTPSANRTRLLLAISFASFSGILSGMCLLFAKSGVELLLLTFRGQPQFWRWQAWVLVLGLIVFALLQLWYLHKGLVLADPTLVCPSAFCFYNLSSIVNGLVYFDQFSLIPPLHLALVCLGIVILLGGVWVVSVQSGGGGVDLGAWASDDDDEMQDLSSDNDSEHDLEHGPGPFDSIGSGLGRGRRRTSLGPVPMDRQTRSESHIPTLNLPSPARPATIAIPALSAVPSDADLRESSSSHSHVAQDSLLLSPASTRRRRLRRSTLQPVAPLSPPLGGGFQIGLSPLSPGFTPVPRERRRRVSGMGFGEVVQDAVAAAGTRHRRRTVSEADVGRAVGLGGDTVDEGAVQGDAGESGKKGKARLRWRWLRRALGGS
ncbi:hypothetical protein PLICRDRAFT_44027 [Plicaturopsis crispa FD-325 SS-3]|nr:hypothetical protein PLICRDRAFT_44027 [Plicaturopsis crispa FD-325 SS-3]